MIDPDDLTPPPSALRRGSGGARVAAIVFFLALGGGLWFWLHRSNDAAPVTGHSEVDAGAIISADSAEPDLRGLPPIDLSDPFVRDWAAKISTDPNVRRWLTTPGLLRRFGAAVASMADGESPRGSLGFLAPAAKLTVVQRSGQTFLAPQSYARYDTLSRAVDSLDIPTTVTALHAVEPLCAAIWKEIAPPGTTFQRSLQAALSRLADARVPEGDIPVVPKGAVWAFADPELESRSAAEKHLIRMGPVNAARLKNKAQALRAALATPSP